jgi:hypothetical protein
MSKGTPMDYNIRVRRAKGGVYTWGVYLNGKRLFVGTAPNKDMALQFARDYIKTHMGHSYSG